MVDNIYKFIRHCLRMQKNLSISNNKNSSAHKQTKYIQQPIRTVDGETRMKIYQIVKLVGEGAYSKCYLVKNQGSESIYVAKVIPKKKLEVLAKEKLVYEIKIHKSLTHPNIVYFDHWFEDETNKYIFLEYCSRGNLEDKLSKLGSMPENLIKKYVKQIVYAIEYIHSQNVLHRDLKLCNFYLDDQDNIKLGDFGFACQLANEIDRKRETCGTPNYIAPEAISGFGYSFSSDVWAIGVILYRLKFGECPFEGETVKQTLMNVKICKYSFPMLRSISAELKDLIQKIFNLNYDDRLTTEEILSHKFFHEDEKTQMPNQEKKKRGFSLTNFFSRQKKPDKSSSKQLTEKKNMKPTQEQKHPKRSNSCEALKEMKHIFKNKSKNSLEMNSMINTKSDLSSYQTTLGRETYRSNIVDSSLNMNLGLLQNSTNIKKQQPTRNSRLNQFIKNQVNSISLKDQLKKGTQAHRNSKYLIQEDEAEKKQQKQKISIIENISKYNQIASEQLDIYSKRVHLPTQVQLEKNIVIISYLDDKIKQMAYEKGSYLIYENITNIFDVASCKKVSMTDLPKIVKHIIENKIFMPAQEKETSSKMQSTQDNDFNDYFQSERIYYDGKRKTNDGNLIQKLLTMVPSSFSLQKDGIVFHYDVKDKVKVGKMYANQAFYVQDREKNKKNLMYKHEKGGLKVVDGVVWENYYSAWIKAICKQF